MVSIVAIDMNIGASLPGCCSGYSELFITYLAVTAAAEAEEEQACLDLADLILETAKRVNQLAQASSAAGKPCISSWQQHCLLNKACLSQVCTVQMLLACCALSGLSLRE